MINDLSIRERQKVLVILGIDLSCLRCGWPTQLRKTLFRGALAQNPPEESEAKLQIKNAVRRPADWVPRSEEV